MSKKLNNQTVYEFSQPQEMINYMFRFSIHKQVVQIPASITLERKVDLELLKKAINLEIERNDCMRLRFFKDGFKYNQLFLEKFVLEDIPVIDFKSKAQQQSYFNKDAQTPLHHMKGEVYRIVLFHAFDGRCGIYINVSHLCMDAAAVFVFFSDLLSVYDAIENDKPLPAELGKFETALQAELLIKNNPEKQQAEEKAFTEHFLSMREPVSSDVHGPERLERLRKRKHNPNISAAPCFNPLFDKAESIRREASVEDSDKIFGFCKNYSISPEVLLQTGMHIYLAKLNNGNPDHYFFTLCTRRNNRNSKRCGGTMTSALSWRTELDNELTFVQALTKMTELQGWIFRHMDYPFINCRRLLQKLFTYSLLAHPSTSMFSWFGLDSGTMSNWEYEYENYSFGRYVMPLYTMAMRNHNNSKLRISYLYRTHYITEKDINNFFDGTIKALTTAIDNPQWTLGKISSEI